MNPAGAGVFSLWINLERRRALAHCIGTTEAFRKPMEACMCVRMAVLLAPVLLLGAASLGGCTYERGSFAATASAFPVYYSPYDYEDRGYYARNFPPRILAE